MASGIYVEGLRECIRSLERFGVEVSDLKEVFTKIGTEVAREAKELAPTKSGALANSIRPSKTKNQAIIRAGSARVVYAGVQNYGGYNNIEPHRFMEGAVERKQADTIRMLDDELGDLIRRYDLN